MKRRAFDVTHESISGNAIVVYGNNTNNPVFRVYHSGTWTAAADVLSSSSADVVEWVQLTSRPGSDEVALVFADNSNHLHAIIWNGSSWDQSSYSRLSTSLQTRATQAFNARFESLTGDLLVAWGLSGTSGVTYNTYSHDGTWGSNATVIYTSDEIPNAIMMEADPNSDRIGLIHDASSNDLESIIWLGSSWSEGKELDNGMGNTDEGDKRVAFAWVGATGKAVFMYDDNDLEGLIKWGDYEEGYGWNVNNAISVPGMAVQSIKMFSILDGTKAHAVISDSNYQLFNLEFDNTTGLWTVLNDGNPITSSLTSLDSIPFTASVNYQDVILLTQHDQEQKTNAFSGAGSETDAVLFAFNMMPHHGNVQINVTQLQLNLSLVTGLIDSDFDGVQLVQDDDVDGVIDAGESAIGGAGNITINGDSGTLTFSSTFTLSSKTSYLISTNVNNLVMGDSVTMDLPTSGITSTTHAVLGSVPTAAHSEGASTLSPDDANEVRLVYGSLNSPDSKPRTRVWDELTASWSTETQSLGSDGRKRFVRHVLSPTSNEELTAFTTDQGGQFLVEVANWDGSNWTLDTMRTVTDDRHSDKRNFDIAYESMSGQAILVYTDGGQTVYYRTRSGGTWSGESTLFGSKPHNNTVMWVQLVPQPGSDRVALVYCDWDADLYSIIWDGNSWLEAETEIELETSLENSDRQNFSAAYESLSGDLFICYSQSWPNDGFSIYTMDYGTNTWSSKQRWRPAWGSRAYYMNVSADPYSDHITCVYDAVNSNVEIGIWNGEQMVELIDQNGMQVLWA